MTDERSFSDAQDDVTSAPDDIEMKIANDIAKRAIYLFVPVAIIVALIGDYKDGVAVLFAGILILANLFIAAQITRVCARISPTAIMIGALGGFAVRLAIIFAIALAVKNLEILDYKLWILSVAIGHIALLAWETKHISFSLGDPGVRPNKK